MQGRGNATATEGHHAPARRVPEQKFDEETMETHDCKAQTRQVAAPSPGGLPSHRAADRQGQKDSATPSTTSSRFFSSGPQLPARDGPIRRPCRLPFPSNISATAQNTAVRRSAGVAEEKTLRRAGTSTPGTWRRSLAVGSRRTSGSRFAVASALPAALQQRVGEPGDVGDLRGAEPGGRHPRQAGLDTQSQLGRVLPGGPGRQGSVGSPSTPHTIFGLGETGAELVLQKGDGIRVPEKREALPPDGGLAAMERAAAGDNLRGRILPRSPPPPAAIRGRAHRRKIASGEWKLMGNHRSIGTCAADNEKV